MNGRWRYGVAGVVAALAGLAVSLGVAWLTDASTNPVLAVASAVRDGTPGPLAIKLIHLVKHADKPLLVTGTVVILLALSWVSGTLARRSRAAGIAVVVVLGVLGIFAVLTQAHAGTSSLVSAVIGLLAWLVAYRALVGEAEQSADLDGSRRRFLTVMGGAVAGSLVVAGAGRWLSAGRRSVERARSRLRLPISSGTVPADTSVGVDGIAPWRTANGDFYRIDTSFEPPAIDPSSWRLRIHGMVDREVEISYDELIGRRFKDAWITLCCVSNEVGGPLISNAYWSGVPVRELLAEAGVHPDADAVKQTSYDGWTCGTPIEALTDARNALLAVGMNGQPLPIAHGFPVRTVVPGLYGYVSATKWVVDLEVTRFDRFQAYWTREGWSEKGPVKTESKIEVPRGGASVKAGTVPVGGVAWAQHTGIAKVEFQVDGGPWTTARIGGSVGNDTWVQWAGSVNVSAGKHELRVRATDKSGYTQTGVQRGVLPDGATGWHSISFHASA